MLNCRESEITKVVYKNVLKNQFQEKSKEEMKMIDYCASDVSVSDRDFKTQTDWNTNTHHQLQCSGSECVKNRHQRSVVVCLVVLCVLLLTAVIVLCVLNYTNNHRFNNVNNKNNTEERDELRAKYNKVTEENKQLNQTKNELLKYLHDGWIYYESSFYYISSEKKSWSESRRYCRERGADLIIINNQQEQDFVKKISDSASLWIGLSDSDVEDRWKWVDGSTLTSDFWGFGEPNGGTKENCVESYTSVWYDYSCDRTYKWICEKSIKT